MKACSKCKVTKDTSAYYRNKATKDGLAGSCKECHKQKMAKWYRANRAKCNAIAAKRRTQKLQATPPWLTQEQLQEIEQFYIDAREVQWLSEEPLEVDHIIPLQGKDVCGLHVPWNLQILPRSWNRKKGRAVFDTKD